MKTVMVYRSETDITVLNYEDTLTGEDVVEEFSCLVASPKLLIAKSITKP